jgi:hypothetical protein
MRIPDFITHYHYHDRKPFLNIMDLNDEERFPIVEELNLRMERGEVKRGFPDWYFIQRRNAESKMRRLFIERGGKPERNSPHYFTLGQSEIWKDIYHHNISSIELSIPPDFPHLYFSLGDSVWCFAESKDPNQQWENQWFQGMLYNYSEVGLILKELKIDLHKPETILGKKIGFVEAFIWSDRDLEYLIEFNGKNESKCGTFLS